MGIYWLMIAVGLIICFGGIYIRKVCAALMGFIWGAIVSFVSLVVIILLTNGTWALWDSLENGRPFIVAIFLGLLIGGLSAWLDRLCAAINTFLGSLLIMFLIAAALMSDIDAFFGTLIFLIVLASVMAVIAYVYYQYAFIIVTAVSGAYIASLGVAGMINDVAFVELIIYLDENATAMMIVITLGLSVAGFCVQRKRLVSRLVNEGQSVTETEPKAPISESGSAEFVSAATERAGVAAVHVAKFAKGISQKVGRIVTPAFKDLGTQFKDAWSELSTEKGRQKLKADLIQNWPFFLPLLIALIVIPFGYKIMYEFYLYESILPAVLSWLDVLAESVSLGVLVYFFIAKDIKLNVLYQILYIAGYLLSYYSGFEFMHFTEFVWTTKYLLVWLVLFFMHRLIKRDQVKIPLLSLLAFCMDCYAVPWIASGAIWFYTCNHPVLRFIIFSGTVFGLFKKWHNINVFQLFSKPDI